jgi:hypothetical protein
MVVPVAHSLARYSSRFRTRIQDRSLGRSAKPVASGANIAAVNVGNALSLWLGGHLASRISSG